MRIVSLGSGSKGNAYLVRENEDALLIDCGLNWKTFSARLGEEKATFHGVLLTHSHVDHVQGLKLFLKHHPEVSVFANAMTAETVERDCGLEDSAFCCFENGQVFEAGPFAVHPFSIPHDTSDPVGYLVRGNDATYFHGTDIGSPLDSIGVKLAQADLATLESNHDPVLLHNSGRSPSLIQRIYGPRGHLSNDQAAELVRRFASPKLKALALAHLSRDCNTPHLAEKVMRETLKEMGREDIALKVLAQDEVVEI